METRCRNLSPEYTEYQKKFNSPFLSKKFDTKNFDQAKFKKLTKDPNPKSKTEKMIKGLSL